MLHSDSTGLQDFGFPSTHSLNAITNPAVILSYVPSPTPLLPAFAHQNVCCVHSRFLFANGTLSFSTCPLFSVFAILLGAFHAGNLILSRLYFGVHSINDCTAGVVRAPSARRARRSIFYMYKRPLFLVPQILGVLEMVVFNSLYSQFEHWMLHSAASPYYVFIFLSALLFMVRPSVCVYAQTVAGQIPSAHVKCA